MKRRQDREMTGATFLKKVNEKFISLRIIQPLEHVVPCRKASSIRILAELQTEQCAAIRSAYVTVEIV